MSNKHANPPDNRYCKLADEQIEAIRQVYDQVPRPRGIIAQLARDYGVTPGTICKIGERHIRTSPRPEAGRRGAS